MGTRTAELEVRLSAQATIKNALPDGQEASVVVGGTVVSGKLLTGVSANQSNRAWEDRDRTLASGASETLDLYDFAGLDIGAGAGKDGLGQTLVLEEIVTLMITQTGGTGRLEIQPTGVANKLTWLPALTVANGGALRVGGVFLLHNPHTSAFDVADASSHLLELKASGGTAIYDIFISGRHDDDESSSSSQSSSSSSSSSVSSQSSSSSSKSSSSVSSGSSSSSSSKSSSSKSSSTQSATTSSQSSLSSSTQSATTSSQSSLSSSSSSVIP